MKIINGIHRTLCPTFPRSGNAFLMLCLRDFFGKDRFEFADIYRHPERSFDQNPRCVFQKTHDFTMDAKCQSNWLCLVQIRNPLPALASWQQLKIREKTMPKDVDTWWQQRMQFYADFVKKWILTPRKNRLVVPYEKLMEKPTEVIAKVIDFITKKDLDLKEIDKLSRITLSLQKPYGAEYPTPFDHV